MNRRQFTQLASAATVSQLLPKAISQIPPPTPTNRFSVMLWTLEKQASFDQCLEIVAAAGYQGVELTGQNQKWSSAETQRIKAKMRSLGLVFDLLSGVKPGFADPNGTAEFLAAVTAQLQAAKDLESPQINLKSGNRIDSLSRQAQRAAGVENLKRAAARWPQPTTFRS